jgi:hypothetical protein
MLKKLYYYYEKALVMVYVLHKLKHYLSSNKFVFYVDQMVLLYLVNNHMFLTS